MAKSTKAQILQHFSELLKDYDLDKITVTMLVSECEISRQTFYYHFNDIQALINAKDINEATIIYLSAIEKNKFFLSKCLESSLSGYTTLLIRESICEYITFFGNKILGISSLEPTDSKFIVDFLANAVTGLILLSIYKEEEMDVKFISEKIEKIILGKITK